MREILCRIVMLEESEPDQKAIYRLLCESAMCPIWLLEGIRLIFQQPGLFCMSSTPACRSKPSA